MTEYDVALVGPGQQDSGSRANGVAILDEHARAYGRHENCRLVACVDPGGDGTPPTATTHAVPETRVFRNYCEMLRSVEPDVLSICAPPAERARLVVDAAETGTLAAIHCDRPLAGTWRETQQMVTACDRAGVSLTFDHWRRFSDVLRDTKALVDDGAIGPLQHVECQWGTSPATAVPAIDVCNFLNDGRTVEWVVGQRDDAVGGASQGDRRMFATWEYDDGVQGRAVPERVADGDWRLVGAEGFIDVHLTDEVAVRVRGANGNTEKRYGALTRGESCTERAIADAIDALETGHQSEVCAANALRAPEIVFGSYESVRRRGRVPFPLAISDDPLAELTGSSAPNPRASDD